METKRSRELTFHKINRTVYVEMQGFTFYLMPLQPTYGHTIKAIWDNAESIDTYQELLSWCKPERKVRVEYTTKKCGVK